MNFRDEADEILNDAVSLDMSYQKHLRNNETLTDYLERKYDEMLTALTALHEREVERIIGEDEDLNAPVTSYDGNPNADKYVNGTDLYVVRRAVRNVYRAEQRRRANREGEE